MWRLDHNNKVMIITVRVWWWRKCPSQEAAFIKYPSRNIWSVIATCFPRKCLSKLHEISLIMFRNADEIEMISSTVARKCYWTQFFYFRWVINISLTVLFRHGLWRFSLGLWFCEQNESLFFSSSKISLCFSLTLLQLSFEVPIFLVLGRGTFKKRKNRWKIVVQLMVQKSKFRKPCQYVCHGTSAEFSWTYQKKAIN